VSGSGISWTTCKSAPRSRQITTPAPHHSVFTGRMPFLRPNQQRQSTEGTIKATKSGWVQVAVLANLKKIITRLTRFAFHRSTLHVLPSYTFNHCNFTSCISRPAILLRAIVRHFHVLRFQSSPVQYANILQLFNQYDIRYTCWFIRRLVFRNIIAAGLQQCNTCQ